MSFGRRAPKRHRAVGPPRRAGRDREAEHEQRVREQRAEDRELRDDELAGREREEHDEELGQVAERRLERARHRRAEPRADGLGRDPDRPRHAAERDPGDDERDDGIGVGEMEDAADDRDGQHHRRDRERLDHAVASLTKPIRPYIASIVGAEAARALSAPTARRRRSSGSSARSAR